MIGRTLNQYRILERLGSGEAGRVYRAEDRRLGRQVAIKVLAVDSPAGPDDAGERLDREARAIADLNHPNIVTLHSVEEADGIHFLALELVAGSTLAELIPHQGFALHRLLALAGQLVAAVGAVHRRGVHHRAIEPDHVMVTYDGRVKILEFGSARLLDSDRPAGTQDAAGVSPYQSPELLRGEVGDQRSDIFALGVLLYHMTTGRLPFEGDSPMATLGAVVSQPPRPIRDLRPSIPEAWSRVVERCLAKDPRQRYRSADALLRDLRGLGPGASRQRLGRSMAVGAAAAILALGWMRIAETRSARAPALQRQEVGETRRMAVVPFRNLGPAETEYFAAGVSEEIRSQLVTVPGLAVVSQDDSDAMAPRGDLEIGRDLDAEWVLGGTVLWEGGEDAAGRVRVIPSLVRTRDGTTVWSRTYDRVLRDIFELQTEIARQVAAQLDLTLFPSPRPGDGSRLTHNLEAYRAYLQGLEQLRNNDFSDPSLLAALRLFQRSVDLDPGFVLGHCRLARTHAARYHFGHDRSTATRAAAHDALRRAVDLAPDDAGVQLALGYVHYWVDKDYARANQALARALEGRPGDVRVLKVLAFVQRRRGRFEAALDTLERARGLTPRDPDLLREIGSTLVFLGRHRQADDYYDRSVELAPDPLFARLAKVRNLLLETGRTAEARQVVERMGGTDDAMGQWYRFWIEIYDGRPRLALDHLRATRQDPILWTHLYLPKPLLAALAHEQLGEVETAERHYRQALEILRVAVDETPDDPRLHAALGHCLAGLGRPEGALEHARRAVQLMPTARDAVLGPYYLEDLALVLTRVGRFERACETLDTLFSVPSQVSVPMVRLDPRWRPLLEQPCARRLLARKDGEG